MDAVEDCKKHCRDNRHKRRKEVRVLIFFVLLLLLLPVLMFIFWPDGNCTKNQFKESSVLKLEGDAIYFNEIYEHKFLDIFVNIGE